MSNNKDIEPFNDKDQPHGYWEIYNASDSLIYKCSYHNGKPLGYEEYYFNGKLIEKNYYL